MVMSGNGATITMMKTIIRKAKRKIPLAPLLARNVCYAAAVGPMPQKALARLPGIVKLRDLPMCASDTRPMVFGVSKEPFKMLLLTV